MMMRLLIISTLLIVGLIGAGFGVNTALTNNAEILTADFGYIEEAIKKDNWPAALDKITQVEESWSKNKNWWAIVIDHQEIDNIEFTFSRIKNYIKAKNTGLSLGELAVLRKTIELIPEKEAVNIRNIF
ncbi:DUF4363 family protein [Desulfolucanica intricata]|uniref:DUF4363 family protein n=1 Tax=Desulfolucanica intricata TaxID=1285191 RepID=UPI0009EE09A8|nr:DUF4363 family protein [Desulfolucanica intricata]